MRFSIFSGRNVARRALATLALIVALTGCAELEQLAPGETPAFGGEGEQAIVTRVIDGDTIDVRLNGRTERVRYIGVNTPERDEVCYEAATAANAALVSGQQVTLVRDVSETDSYGRLLRYVYVGDVFVHGEMVAVGFAEARAFPSVTRQQMSLDTQ